MTKIVFRADPDDDDPNRQHLLRGDVLRGGKIIGRFSGGKAYSPASINLINGRVSPTIRIKPHVKKPLLLRRQMLIDWIERNS